MVAHYLIKSEPDVFSFQKFVADGTAVWDGVRNYAARNHLRAMRVGDLALFYHSNIGKEIVGVARVTREAYPDPTASSGDWSAVDFAPVVAFAVPVSLARIKSEPALAAMELLRQSRLSVQPVRPEEFRLLLAMGKTKLPRGR